MTINKQENNTELIIAPKGRIDTVTAPILEKELKSSIENKASLILDFKEVEYISSAGLRIILSAQKIMSSQGEMKLKNVNDTVMEVLNITGFSEILTIEK